MSDYNRYNQGTFGGNWASNPTGRGEGGASDAALEQRYSQSQNPQPLDPNDALLQGALQDPVLKQQMAEQLRQRFSGQQQQQQADPLQSLRDEIDQLKERGDTIRAMPEDNNKPYGELYEVDRQYMLKRQELISRENDQRYEQQNAQVRNGQAQQVYRNFLEQALRRLPLDDQRMFSLAEEFTYQLRNMYDNNALSDPDALQRLLPQAFAAFAYEKNLPRPGQPQSQQPQGQAPRVGEQYNGMQAPPPPPPDPNDPLASLAEMNDHERAMLKAFYFNKGQYDIADKITNRDGSPIVDRTKL